MKGNKYNAVVLLTCGDAYPLAAQNVEASLGIGGVLDNVVIAVGRQEAVLSGNDAVLICKRKKRIQSSQVSRTQIAGENQKNPNSFSRRAK